MAGRWYLCGVPKDKCKGSFYATNQGLNKNIMAHASHETAFKCHCDYLISLGYKKIGSKEFEAPDGGPVRVLTRPGKFGAPMRRGKNKDGIGNRIVPKRGKKSFGGHVVIN